MSRTKLKKGMSLDEIISVIGSQVADPQLVWPYNTDRQVTLSYGSLAILLEAIKKAIEKK